MPTMPEYRYYFRDSDGKLRGTQTLDCEDDTAAAVTLEILLEGALNNPHGKEKPANANRRGCRDAANIFLGFEPLNKRRAR